MEEQPTLKKSLSPGRSSPNRQPLTALPPLAGFQQQRRVSLVHIVDHRLFNVLLVTIVEDASGIVRVYSVSGDGGLVPVTAAARSCVFQGTTAGSCVETLAPGVGQPSGTVVASYTGSLTPIYTLTQTASVPSQTQTSGDICRRNANIWSVGGLVLSGAVVLHIVALVV